MLVEGSSLGQVISDVPLSGSRAVQLALFAVFGGKERRKVDPACFFHRNEFLY